MRGRTPLRLLPRCAAPGSSRSCISRRGDCPVRPNASRISCGGSPAKPTCAVLLVHWPAMSMPPGPMPGRARSDPDGAYAQAGIEEIGIGAYPEGHPSHCRPGGSKPRSTTRSPRAATSLKSISSRQFCFRPGPHRRLAQATARAASDRVGIGHGRADRHTALIRYARRCGVTASISGLSAARRRALLGRKCRARQDP